MEFLPGLGRFVTANAPKVRPLNGLHPRRTARAAVPVVRRLRRLDSYPWRNRSKLSGLGPGAFRGGRTNDPPVSANAKKTENGKSDDSPVVYEREFPPRSVCLLCDGLPTIWWRRDRPERRRRLREFDSHMNEPVVTRINTSYPTFHIHLGLRVL